MNAWEIGEQSAGKPLGKFGCKVVQRVRIEPTSTPLVHLSDNFLHASAAPPLAAHNLAGAFEAGSSMEINHG